MFIEQSPRLLGCGSTSINQKKQKGLFAIIALRISLFAKRSFQRPDIIVVHLKLEQDAFLFYRRLLKLHIKCISKAQNSLAIKK
jgi:hypothetical protein